jgi:hypothetical protein
MQVMQAWTYICLDARATFLVTFCYKDAAPRLSESELSDYER